MHLSLITTVKRTLTPAAQVLADKTLLGHPLKHKINNHELSRLLFPAYYGSVLVPLSVNGLCNHDMLSVVVR